MLLTDFNNFSNGQKALFTKDFYLALKYFKTTEQYIECAYCLIILNKIDEAQNYLEMNINDSSFANWCKILINLFKYDKFEFPTYFQIRNFLEQDLDNFFATKSLKNIEKLSQYIKKYALVNPSVYKFFARASFNNGYFNEAIKYLDFYLNEFYKDSEAHYLLGEIYYQKKEFKKSLKHYEITNKLVPDIKKIKEKINELTYSHTNI